MNKKIRYPFMCAWCGTVGETPELTVDDDVTVVLCTGCWRMGQMTLPPYGERLRFAAKLTAEQAVS